MFSTQTNFSKHSRNIIHLFGVYPFAQYIPKTLSKCTRPFSILLHYPAKLIGRHIDWSACITQPAPFQIYKGYSILKSFSVEQSFKENYGLLQFEFDFHSASVLSVILFHCVLRAIFEISDLRENRSNRARNTSSQMSIRFVDKPTVLPD